MSKSKSESDAVAIPGIAPNITSEIAERSPDLSGVRRLCEEAYTRYLLELQEIWSRAQRASADAYETYIREVEEVYKNAGERYQNLHRGFWESVQELAEGEEGQKQAQSAYEDFVRKGNEVFGPAEYLKLFEAYSRYLHAVRTAWSADTVRSQLEEAYRSYLTALKRSWDELDTKVLNAANLAAIGNSLRSAACWAGWTLG